MLILLLLIAAFALPLTIVLLTGQHGKRGCGRGCATCGNRDICHRRKKGN